MQKKFKHQENLLGILSNSPAFFKKHDIPFSLKNLMSKIQENNIDKIMITIHTYRYAYRYMHMHDSDK